MLVAAFPAGPWGTNCYVIASAAGEECLVIDPGKDAAPGIAEIVREHALRPAAVLLTHGHIDHMWSVTPVTRKKIFHKGSQPPYELGVVPGGH